MKNRHLHIIIGFLLFGFISCIGIKTIKQTTYIGNFRESNYGFFESFRHTNDQDYYYNLPFELKFGGIRLYPFDSIGKKDYSWLRNPTNLKIAFNSVKLIGLDKFVSFRQYNKKNSDWCCDTQWENKSLNDIVKGFLLSDTISNGKDYYSKFWQRRRIEKNLKEAWQIFQQIDDFYNSKKSMVTESTFDTTLYQLLDYDIKLINSDSLSYPKITLRYFDYLKKIELDYSAYKLIFHNSRLNFSRTFRDSLLLTMKYDTLDVEDWGKMNDNIDGWITGEIYPDPNRNYGP
ncbi:MAG: hypothetical protein K9H64_08130 [Bacteroidales bacterium]|nr:hypothetical protein [Bacteroidales bacterium]MCF8455798.1 hypothetical protein [Bacteroidales bacterium]